MKLAPLNFKRWIDDHRHLLKPPVGNQVVYEDTEFIIMVVGGPNARTDFHIDPAEEFFYQLEGSMVLRVEQDGKIDDIEISAGEIMLLPANVPHSPQRKAGGVGLVVERRRRADEIDGCRWYCENCVTPLYQEYFHLEDITKDLPPVFDRFYADEANRTCKRCGYQVPLRASPAPAKS
jgi:3-hydroxyanthranilate 3,4-dioxygenase